MYDLNSLQQNLTNSVSSNVTNSLTSQLMDWLLIGSTVLTVLFLILYIVHMIRRHKLEKAIFEMRDLLRDIKDAQTLVAAKHSKAIDATRPLPEVETKEPI